MTDKLIIFDTTLRDGEQSPGASMTRDEKLRIARQLERLKVDVIEAGFAASSNGDFEAVQLIANTIKDSTICSLSRANDRDISRAAEALKGANRARIHTFIATSALHMEKKLRMTPEQVLEQARRTNDQATRANLYHKFQEMFLEKVPGIPLYYPVYNYGVSEKVADVQIGPIAFPSDRFRRHLERIGDDAVLAERLRGKPGEAILAARNAWAPGMVCW